MRYQLAQSLGGVRGMLEAALPFVAFTIAWVIGRQLYPGPRRGTRRWLRCWPWSGWPSGSRSATSLTAVFPTAIAAFVATRTGRAEDVFLPGILYNGALALLSLFTVAVRRPLVGFVIGAAVGDPTGWAQDRGLVRMTSKLTLVLAVPYLLRFVVQLPLFLAGQVVWLGVAKVVLGWPLLIAALAVIGLLLSKGRTPMEGSALASAAPRRHRLAPRRSRRATAGASVHPRVSRSGRSGQGRRRGAGRQPVVACLRDGQTECRRGGGGLGHRDRHPGAQHLGQLLLVVLGGDEQQLVRRPRAIHPGPAAGRGRRG